MLGLYKHTNLYMRVDITTYDVINFTKVNELS